MVMNMLMETIQRPRRGEQISEEEVVRKFFQRQVRGLELLAEVRDVFGSFISPEFEEARLKRQRLQALIGKTEAETDMARARAMKTIAGSKKGDK